MEQFFMEGRRLCRSQTQGQGAGDWRALALFQIEDVESVMATVAVSPTALEEAQLPSLCHSQAIDNISAFVSLGL